jgi:hypothetical protein
MGNAYAAGRAHTVVGSEDFLVMKLLAASGHIDWLETAGGLAQRDDIAWAIAVGPDDNPVVTGISVNADETANFWTIKYDQSNGSQVWDRSLPGAVNNVTRAGWLAMADNGDAIMVNRSWNAASSYDVILQRYAAGDGGSVYAKVYNSPSNRLDDPRAMTRDTAGDIYVAGVHNSNYMVLKFNGSTGDTLWTAGYNGPPGWYDVANCVATGPGGEVIASGFSDGTGTGWDVATVGLDSQTGDRLWVVRYDGDDGQADEGRALAVSDLGDIYVVGYSYSIAANMDMLALRYSASDLSRVADLPLVPRLVAAYPNPFNPRISLAVDMPDGCTAQLAIYDLQGRRLAILQDGHLEAGTHTFRWDGRDERGWPVASGAYLARFESAGSAKNCKIVLAK